MTSSSQISLVMSSEPAAYRPYKGLFPNLLQSRGKLFWTELQGAQQGQVTVPAVLGKDAQHSTDLENIAEGGAAQSLGCHGDLIYESHSGSENSVELKSWSACCQVQTRPSTVCGGNGSITHVQFRVQDLPSHRRDVQISPSCIKSQEQ